MSKPIWKIEIETPEGKKAKVTATFDTGSFYTIIQENCIPKGALIAKYKEKKFFGTAQKKSKLDISGVIVLKMKFFSHMIQGEVLVSPHLSTDMLIGAGLMQMWDISIKNKNGHTTIHMGRDMNDPEIQTVL